MVVTKDLVTICVPTYNAEKYLTESLNCIVSQTYPNIQILIIDDGSTDSTEIIIDKFINKYSNIDFIKNADNLGLVNNWNKCLQYSNGEWIKFHFQDDLADPTCIEEMVNYINAVDKNLLLCDRNFLFEDDITPERKAFFSKFTHIG